ncbi:MAG TPA: hypothetical protein VNE38_19000 [Ktedonobacteraceae bacterium]|nr:hypothetical protein [Ktedonobacteraceae bacterium]
MVISKRMLICIGIVGVIVLGALGFTFAFLISQVNASSSASATPTSTVAAATPAAKANRACALGIVQSINSQNQAIVVSEANGKKTVTVTVNATTTFHKHGVAAASFSSLAVGQHVRVTAQGSCDRKASTFVAQAITVIMATASPTPIPAVSTIPASV